MAVGAVLSMMIDTVPSVESLAALSATRYVNESAPLVPVLGV